MPLFTCISHFPVFPSPHMTRLSTCISISRSHLRVTVLQELDKAPQAQAPQPSAHQLMSSPSNAGRKSKFSSDEDLVIAQKVSAADPHGAPHPETMSCFEVAARKANENPHFKNDISGKNLQDRFKKLTDDFARRENRGWLMSGTGGEIGELDHLLGDMLEAMRETQATKNNDAAAKSDQESNELLAETNSSCKLFMGKAWDRRGGFEEWRCFAIQKSARGCLKVSY